jgi:AcrR family transcriptional regulator
MGAAAELIAEQGYNGTRLADITRRAGIAQKTLYEYFVDKEDILLAVFDETVDDAIRRVEAACAEPGGWAERIEAGIAAFLGHIAEKPALARVCLIDAPSATPAATKRYQDALQRCVQLGRRTLPHDGLLPDTIEETLVGGLMWIVYQQVRRREAEQIETLLPQLSEFVLAPYVGAGVIDRAGSTADR